MKPVLESTLGSALDPTMKPALRSTLGSTLEPTMKASLESTLEITLETISMETKSYTIGQVSDVLGIPSSTVRYYEAKGLLPSIRRTEGGIRVFTEEDLDWIRLIGHLKLSGMTLSEIREFTNLYQQGDKTIEDRRALVHRRRDEIKRQLEDLNNTLDFITYKCWFYDTTAEAGTCDVPASMSEDDMPAKIAAIKRKRQIGSH